MSPIIPFINEPELERILAAAAEAGASTAFGIVLRLPWEVNPLFQNWLHSREGQQILVDYARQYSPHAQTVEKPGVRKLADIKLMKEDAEGVEKGADEIKRRYGQIFRV